MAAVLPGDVVLIVEGVIAELLGIRRSADIGRAAADALI
jgi:hypothetical protein